MPVQKSLETYWIHYVPLLVRVDMAMKEYSTFPGLKAGDSVSNSLVLYPGHSLWEGGVLLLCRDAIGVFYNSSQVGLNVFNGMSACWGLFYIIEIREEHSLYVHIYTFWVVFH